LRRFLLKYDNGNQVHECVLFSDGTIALHIDQVQATGTSIITRYKSLDELRQQLPNGDLEWIDADE